MRGDEPCCDSRDHRGWGDVPGLCDCPEHERSRLHPYGWDADDVPYWDGSDDEYLSSRPRSAP